MSNLASAFLQLWFLGISIKCCSLFKISQELNRQIEKRKEMEEREKRKIIAEVKHKEWVQKKNKQVNKQMHAYCSHLQSLSSFPYLRLLTFPFLCSQILATV